MSEKVKLLMSWDFQPNQESQTLEFMANELAPAVQQLGITPTEAWYTVYGERPQILVGVVADDLATMQRVLDSKDWQELVGKLGQYIQNYEQRLVRAKGSLQL